MAAFRLFSKLNTFYGLTAQLLAGGELRFYEAGSVTPKAVYGDEALSVNNGATIDLDSSGRPNVDVWGDGAYFVEAYDALGAKQGEADDVSIPGAGGLTIPSLSGNNGKFLTTDGSVLLWNAIREVPDPTGQGGKFLSTDGTLLLWQSTPTPPTPPQPNVDVTGTGVSINDGSQKVLLQCGSATGTNSGGRTQTVNVTFATSFSAPPIFIVCTLTNPSGLSPYGNQPSPKIPSKSTTGFTVVWVMGELDDSNSGWNFNAAVDFDYFAIGLMP